MTTPEVRDQPPQYRMLGMGTARELAAEAAPLRRLCDVHLAPGGGATLRNVQACCNHAVQIAEDDELVPSPGSAQKLSGAAAPAKRHAAARRGPHSASRTASRL